MHQIGFIDYLIIGIYFAFVIGIGRSSRADELLNHGASVVVEDMSELGLRTDVVVPEPL